MRIGKGEFHCLDLQMHTVCGVDGHLGQGMMSQDAEREKRSQSLAVRRDLVQLVSVVFGRDRGDPIGCVLGEVLFRHEPAIAAGVGDNRSC